MISIQAGNCSVPTPAFMRYHESQIVELGSRAHVASIVATLTAHSVIARVLIPKSGRLFVSTNFQPLLLQHQYIISENLNYVWGRAPCSRLSPLIVRYFV